MTSATLLPNITDCSIGSIVWSDHAPITMTMQDQYQHRGRSPWCLNDTLLHNTNFTTKLSDNLRTYFELNNSSEITATILWQAHKSVLRGLLVTQASFLKRQQEREHTDLLRKLRDTTNEHILNPSEELTKSTVNITNQINTMSLNKTAHILTKLKMKTYTQGNRAGKHLAVLLRQRQANSKIPYLMANTGGKIHNPEDINNEMANYYQSVYNLNADTTLYQPTDREITEFLQQTTLPTLTSTHKQALEHPVSSQEIMDAIQALPPENPLAQMD
ncbi:LINE-1 reverse transcriptase [Pelobates cultripes]|uniref:LINE-1 reverse transcriptase n=1 Tax=Pelobates cultripes TaxID=61616 RepID=A0AAD1TPI6_PELCU|nr:LINE-1 reverse transcriptase [Pelobates cultripes]